MLAWDEIDGVALLYWQRISGITAAFTSRHGGVSAGPYRAFNLGFASGDDPARVAENRRRLCHAVSADPSRTGSCRQSHSPIVIHADDDPVRAFDDATLKNPAGDAQVTSEPGRALVAFGADCATIVAARLDASRVAVCHAGWRGLASGVVEQTLRAVGGDAACAIGPCAGPDRYHVRGDVAALLQARFGPAALRGDCADLAFCARSAATRAGAVVVDDAALCTISDPDRFYSHRRDGARCGRQAVIAYRNPSERHA